MRALVRFRVRVRLFSVLFGIACLIACIIGVLIRVVFVADSQIGRVEASEKLGAARPTNVGARLKKLFTGYKGFFDVTSSSDYQYSFGGVFTPTEAGVVALVNVGCDIEGSRRAAESAARFDTVWATAGVHPHDAAGCTAQTLDEMARMIAHERVMAVGEVGLDYHYDHAPREVQREVFRRQIALARALRDPRLQRIGQVQHLGRQLFQIAGQIQAADAGECATAQLVKGVHAG